MIQPCSADITEDGRELASHGLSSFPAACYYDEPLKEPSPWHWHEELEFNIVTEGRVRYHLNGMDRELRPGEGAFVNSKIVHALFPINEEPCVLHSITFHPRLVGGSRESVYWQNYLEPLLSNDKAFGFFLSPSVEWQKKIMDQVEAAWQNALKEEKGYEFFFRNHLSLAMFEVCSHIDSVPAGISEKNLRTQNRMRQMLGFIHEHYSEALSLQEIAEAAGISKSEALRCFRDSIHSTPVQYLRSYRLQKAAALLKNTDWRIIEIGLACGFQEMTYFARSFRGQYGMTPGEYRKLHLREGHSS